MATQKIGGFPSLDKELSFPMYACSKELIKLYTPYLEDLDLTYTQYLTMMLLWDEKQATVKTLGEELYLNSATMTPILKKLESKGYLTRTRMKSDERNVLITITREGEALKSRAAGISDAVMDSLQLEENEAKVLFILMYKILHKITE